MRREWIEIRTPLRFSNSRSPGLPPCGGSGLKYKLYKDYNIKLWVSLHAEGVD